MTCIWSPTARRLTDWSADYREALPIFPQEELNATAPDGYPVHGWVVRPAGAGPLPVLLMIHGGPFAQYAWRLFDEAQVYAGAGYAVVMGNPRGSSGYGETHGRAIVGNVGEVSRGRPAGPAGRRARGAGPGRRRVGVLGGSHGGFMTTWLAAHHGDRFKAAISERAVNAIDSFAGSSDIGWFFADALYGAPTRGPEPAHLRRPDQRADAAHPLRARLALPDRAGTAALRRAEPRGAPVEMLLFPGEGHELSRSGRPSHRVARFDAILDWFERYL